MRMELVRSVVGVHAPRHGGYGNGRGRADVVLPGHLDLAPYEAHWRTGAAMSGEYSPLTVANTRQRLVAKVADAALGRRAASTVHATQTRLALGRSLLANIVRLERAIEEFAFHFRDRA